MVCVTHVVGWFASQLCNFMGDTENDQANRETRLLSQKDSVFSHLSFLLWEQSLQFETMSTARPQARLWIEP